MRSKITVIGAGDIGAVTAQRLVERDYADVVLLEVTRDAARAKAHDLAEAASLAGYEPRVTGTDDYEDTSGSDVVVITAMSDDTGTELRDHSPDAIVISAVTPPELMCHEILDATKFPRERVMGIAPLLDSSRFRMLVARKLGVSVRDVSGLVLGGSGEAMVPVVSRANVAGIPLTRLVDERAVAEIVARTRRGADESVFGASAAIREIVDSILLDRRRILPCTALCDREFGLEGVCVGVPVMVGAQGIEEIVALELDAREREQLERSAQASRARA